MVHAFADQRLAASDADRIHPALRKQCGKAEKFFVCQDIFPFQFLHTVRHTVAAAQVAQVGD